MSAKMSGWFWNLAINVRFSAFVAHQCHCTRNIHIAKRHNACAVLIDFWACKRKLVLRSHLTIAVRQINTTINTHSCTHTRTFPHMHTHTYARTHTHTHTHAHTQHTHPHTHMDTYTPIVTHVHTHIHTNMYLNTHVRTHVHVHAHTHEIHSTRISRVHSHVCCSMFWPR